MHVQFIPDTPVNSNLSDTLGFGRFLDLLENALYHTETPFTYGVLGDWGVGKTSILNLLQRRLDKKFKTNAQPYIPIWFNAWKYENETNIIYPLLHAIKQSYEDEERLEIQHRSRKFVEQFKTVTVSSMLALTDVLLRTAAFPLTGGGPSLEDIAKHIKTVKQNGGGIDQLLGEWADEISELENAFDQLLNIYAQDIAKGTNFGAKDVRFVILVDDLDRCLPETTIRILEGIKNFLTTKRTIFVLALNPTVVYKGIAIKYRGLEINGREYLEKILNYSFNVPEPTTDNVKKFVEGQFEQLVPNGEDRQRYQGRFTEFGQVLDKCRFNNPRKIKRILNRYLFFLQLHEAHLNYYLNDQIVRFIVMAEYYPDLFKLYVSGRPRSRAEISLAKLNSSDFALESFEQFYGITIRPIFGQLQAKHELFKLDEGHKDGKGSLQEHAQVVAQLSQGGT